jgi:hypothetical protein
MSNDRQSVLQRAGGLKKAGLSTAAVIAIAAVSAPGFWSAFFDETDDRADRKAEAAYDVLRTEIEFMQRDDERLLAEIQGLRQTMLLMHLSKPRGDVGEEAPREECAAELGDLLTGDLGGFGIGGGGLGSASDSLGSRGGGSKPKTAKSSKPKSGGKKAAVDSLDMMIQQQQPMPVRKKLPDNLDDLVK